MAHTQYIGLSFIEAKKLANQEGLVLRQITVGSSAKNKRKSPDKNPDEIVYVEVAPDGIIVAIH